MKPLSNIISIWFGFVMVVSTFFGALIFAFTGFMEDRLFGKNRTIFIWTLLAYSVYRGFRLYQTYKRSRNEDQA